MSRMPKRSGRIVTPVVLGVTSIAVLSVVGGLALLRRIGRDDPAQYEARVAEIETAFHGDPSQGGVLLSGSSFFENWKTSAADLAPLDTTNIGIGGTRAGDHLAFFDRMVLPFHPRALVLYIGSNDISGLPLYSKSPETTVALIRLYIETAAAKLPGCRIYYVAITEAPSRKHVRADIQTANRQLAQIASDIGTFTFIDTAPALLRPDGSIDYSLFGADRLHFNDKGYRAFSAAIRKGLQEEYRQREDISA